MAEITPSAANITAVANLEEALAHPEPMCLAMLEIHLPADAVPAADGTRDHDRDGDVDGDGVAGSPEDRLMDEAYLRLQDTLRDYDHLTRLDSNRFILILRTLADASILSGRMRSLYEIMTRPYGFSADGEASGNDGSDGESPDGASSDAHREIQAEVFLGAAIRMPQETATQLLGRVDQAVLLARSAADGGPVVL